MIMPSFGGFNMTQPMGGMGRTPYSGGTPLSFFGGGQGQQQRLNFRSPMTGGPSRFPGMRSFAPMRPGFASGNSYAPPSPGFAAGGSFQPNYEPNYTPPVPQHQGGGN